jgi:hypothetical protein
MQGYNSTTPPMTMQSCLAPPTHAAYSPGTRPRLDTSIATQVLGWAYMLWMEPPCSPGELTMTASSPLQSTNNTMHTSCNEAPLAPYSST